jgi:REP element-mobilizing transposase RayT
MTYDPERHHRRSIRLQGYDYAQAGAYFLTVCTQDRTCLFGEVVDGAMCPNDAGRMVETVWDELPLFYPGVDIDRFAVMPNHIHGIIVLVGAAPRGRPDAGPARGPAPTDGRPDAGPARGPAPTDGRPDAGPARGPAPTALSLADVVHRFKTMTTNRYAVGAKQRGWPAFRRRLWQRNYYEHVIRDEPALNRIRRYIDENPLRWAVDDENPHRAKS